MALGTGPLTTTDTPTQTGAGEEIREIEAAAPPARFARGWHCLGLSNTYRDGQPHQIEAFGTSLVVFADSKGDIKILDAYCRHMGGNLAHGNVKGDSIACPFHDWRWGGNGKCTAIPYARRVPPLAKTRAWITLEKNGQLFVWHDPQGNPPPAEVTIPDIEGFGSDEWSDWSWNTLTIEGSHCREIVDNVVDMAHFFYVHFSFPTYFKNVFEGHVAIQEQSGINRDDIVTWTDPDVPKLVSNFSVAAYHGPSFMIDDLVYQYETFKVDSVLINCHYPVSPNKFVLMYGITVKKTDDLPAGIADQTVDAMIGYIGVGFEQDIEIWKNKTRIDNPLLCTEDGPVYQLRRWYEQFYVDVADVTPEMVDRFEFEMDTSKPIEAWKQEVADNLARKAAAGAPQ